MSGLRVLVTGANGLVGQHAMERLASQPGHEPVGWGRRDAPLFRGELGDYTRVDLTDASSLGARLDGLRPDVVLHAAALSNVDACQDDRAACWRINVDATREIARWCARHDRYLAHLSTDFVFDGRAGPYREEDEPAPINTYGESKLAAERELASTPGLRWSAARTVLVHGRLLGPSRPPLVVRVAESLRRGEAVSLVADHWRTPTDVDDLVDGILRLVSADARGVWNLAGEELLSIHGLGRRVARRLGLDESLVRSVEGREISPLAPRPARTGLVISRARREIGFSPRPLDDSLDRVLRG